MTTKESDCLGIAAPGLSYLRRVQIQTCPELHGNKTLQEKTIKKNWKKRLNRSRQALPLVPTTPRMTQGTAASISHLVLVSEGQTDHPVAHDAASSMGPQECAENGTALHEASRVGISLLSKPPSSLRTQTRPLGRDHGDQLF